MRKYSEKEQLPPLRLPHREAVFSLNSIF